MNFPSSCTSHREPSTPWCPSRGGRRCWWRFGPGRREVQTWSSPEEPPPHSAAGRRTTTCSRVSPKTTPSSLRVRECTAWGIPSFAIFRRTFLTCSPSCCLILQLQCSPISNLNIQKETLQNIANEGTPHGVHLWCKNNTTALIWTNLGQPSGSERPWRRGTSSRSFAFWGSDKISRKSC